MKKFINLFQYKCGVLNYYMCYGKCKMQLMSNRFNMLIVEKMSKKSLTHRVHYIDKIKGYFNFHVSDLKLF